MTFISSIIGRTCHTSLSVMLHFCMNPKVFFFYIIRNFYIGLIFRFFGCISKTLGTHPKLTHKRLNSFHCTGLLPTHGEQWPLSKPSRKVRRHISC